MIPALREEKRGQKDARAKAKKRQAKLKEEEKKAREAACAHYDRVQYRSGRSFRAAWRLK